MAFLQKCTAAVSTSLGTCRDGTWTVCSFRRNGEGRSLTRRPVGSVGVTAGKNGKQTAVLSSATLGFLSRQIRGPFGTSEWIRGHPPRKACLQSRAVLCLSMEYQKLGTSDLEVSRIGLGTMTFGEGNSYKEATYQLCLARDAGVNLFDTAEMYPVPQRRETQGATEQFVGQWLRESKTPRDKVILATKLQVTGPSSQMTWIRDGPVSLDGKNITQAIEGSLRRLNVDCIDLYQIHWPDRYVPMFGDVDYDPSMDYSATSIEEQLGTLSKAISQGKIRYVGLSNETPWGLMQFCRIADSSSQFPRIVSVQNAYNLLCRTFDSGLAECCHRETVGLLAYSPLAMGLLTGKYYEAGGGSPDARLNKYRGRYAEAEGRYGLEKINVKDAVQAYVAIARKFGLSPVALALGFVLRNSLVASALIGATTTRQLEEVLSAASVPLIDEVMDEVNKVHGLFPNPTP